jgi:UDP-N-acetylglucosamine diphosphorylase / glucose-1-phosphate thymidylyltransferase / UDP-N-acetylgalactosamine diphosphorylase / glucosamine-1-phosphate N-acetyltransferase / galactosamine-1-phosphate N-acetyltransferase
MMNVVIPMAGLGSRFAKVGIDVPKPLITVKGITLLEHSIRSFNIPDARFILITRDFGTVYNNQIQEIATRLRPEVIILKIDTVTSGAAETVLAAKDYIDNPTNLVVYNCDQIIDWNPNQFLEWIATGEKTIPDGAVVCYKSTDPKNSFAKIKMGSKIEEFREKSPISDHALIGFHFWKHGSDYVSSANLLLRKFRNSGSPECYVSETYNYLLELGKTIRAYHIPNYQYIPLGTPEDVAKYIGKTNEFNNTKPRSIFLDIDGTILKHMHTISDVYEKDAELCAGVREKLNAWDSQGHRIILTTARKESTRQRTEQQLASLGIAYDQLVMGLTTGPRVLVNDKLAEHDPDRAISINVITDQGFNSTNWEAQGL